MVELIFAVELSVLVVLVCPPVLSVKVEAVDVIVVDVGVVSFLASGYVGKLVGPFVVVELIVVVESSALVVLVSPLLVSVEFETEGFTIVELSMFVVFNFPFVGCIDVEALNGVPVGVVVNFFLIF